MKQFRLLTLLALLMTAATGAWAQDAKHLITDTYAEQTRSLEQPLPYATTIGALYDAVTGESFSDLISDMTALEKPLTGISSNNTSVVSIGEFNDANTPVTVKADGEATVAINFSGKNRAIHVIVVPPLYAYVKDGVKDAYEWTVKVGEGQAQALPIGGLKGDGSETVTLQYTGRLKVKSVKAVKKAAPKPDLLPAVFTVDAGKTVKFSKGNLQATYNGSSWIWGFAEHQWDYIGNAAGNTSINGNGTVSANGTVDLFGWVGASSTWTGAAQYGISNSTATNNVDGYGNVGGEAQKVGWGATVGPGWRTLTSSEWLYLLSTRETGVTVNTTNHARYTLAIINTDGTAVKGLIIFPDSYAGGSPAGVTWGTINAKSTFETTCTTCTSAGWTALEAAGCVFLPAAGYRTASTVTDAGDGGGYWSSSSGNASYANSLYFQSDYMNIQFGGSRKYGFSVRLVQATSDAAPAANIVDLSKLTENKELKDGDVLTGTLAANVKVSIADGATVTLDGVTINGVSDINYEWAGITCLGDATIILSGTNTVKGFYEDYPGIQAAAADKTLTINGTGSLTASSYGYAAAIGGKNGVACGNIEIQGGTITATSGGRGAGIGGGNNAACGNITISGGTVSATGGQYGAGIGGGYNASWGTITISGGTVEATGGKHGAGIGGGRRGNASFSGGNIIISGGTVTATGGEYAAGIGGGRGNTNKQLSSCGTITITTGVTEVTATKGSNATNSIGAGYWGNCGTVTIGGTLDTNGNPVGGTKYWENNAAVGDGATYLAQATIEYPAPAKAAKDATAEDLGKVIGADGNIYDDADAATAANTTAVAMIAYLGNGSDCTNGLAIQLNASPEKKNWNDAKTYASGLTAVPGGTWRLPSKADWQNMFVGCAKSGDAGASDSMDPIAGFKEKIGATGITWNSNSYWSSTDSGSKAWNVNVWLKKNNAAADFGEQLTSDPYLVLGCLAF